MGVKYMTLMFLYLDDKMQGRVLKNLKTSYRGLKWSLWCTSQNGVRLPSGGNYRISLLLSDFSNGKMLPISDMRLIEDVHKYCRVISVFLVIFPVLKLLSGTQKEGVKGKAPFAVL